jgi:hypothetical protein
MGGKGRSLLMAAFVPARPAFPALPARRYALAKRLSVSWVGTADEASTEAS